MLFLTTLFRDLGGEGDVINQFGRRKWFYQFRVCAKTNLTTPKQERRSLQGRNSRQKFKKRNKNKISFFAKYIPTHLLATWKKGFFLHSASGASRTLTDEGGKIPEILIDVSIFASCAHGAGLTWRNSRQKKRVSCFLPSFLQFFFLKRDIARKNSMENSLFLLV